MITIQLCRAAALALIAVIFAYVTIGSAAAAEKLAGVSVPLLAGPTGPVTFIQPAAPTVAQPEAATFIVTYTGSVPRHKRHSSVR